MAKKVKQETVAVTVQPEAEEKESKKNKVVRAKKAKHTKKVKTPKPPKQKKEKRSAKRQRIAYEKALKKTSAERTLSLIAIALALFSSVLSAIMEGKNDGSDQ